MSPEISTDWSFASSRKANASLIGGFGTRRLVTSFTDLVHCHQLPQIGHPFVRHARVDVIALIGHEGVGHGSKAPGGMDVDLGRPWAELGIVERRAIFQRVVGVQMRDEDVPHGSQAHACRDQLAGHTMAAVDQIGRIVEEDQCRGIGSTGPGKRRPAPGAQQGDTGSRGRRAGSGVWARSPAGAANKPMDPATNVLRPSCMHASRKRYRI